MTSRLILAALIAALGACQTPPIVPAPEPTPAPSPSPSACAVLDSRDWEAWIDRMPGPGATSTLHVTGQLDLPHAGYSVTVRDGPADRSATPTQQIIIETTQRSGMHAQVVTTADVTYQAPAIAQTYRSIRVMCGGRQLAEIGDVPGAH